VTSTEFEELAKRAVCQTVWVMHEEFFKSDQISVVWMVHVLGNKKAVLIDSGENSRLYEVTYNAEKNQLYVDEYDKVENRAFYGEQIKDLQEESRDRNRSKMTVSRGCQF